MGPLSARGGSFDLGTVVVVTKPIVVIVVLVQLAAWAWFVRQARGGAARPAVETVPAAPLGVPSPAAQGRVPVEGEPPIVGPPTAPEITVQAGVSTPPQGIPAQIPPSRAITPPEGFPAQSLPDEDTTPGPGPTTGSRS